MIGSDAIFATDQSADVVYPLIKGQTPIETAKDALDLSYGIYKYNSVEFWYCDSIRFVKISQAVEPMIFSGGVLYNNDFDLPHYDFDLTRLLPYCWEGSV